MYASSVVLLPVQQHGDAAVAVFGPACIPA
jgi:hypothetical protein